MKSLQKIYPTNILSHVVFFFIHNTISHIHNINHNKIPTTQIPANMLIESNRLSALQSIHSADKTKVLNNIVGIVGCFEI